MIYKFIKKSGFLVAALLISFGAKSQTKEFDYTFAMEGMDRTYPYPLPLKVTKDNSIVSLCQIYGPTLFTYSLIHKLSPDGKLIWKSLLELVSEPSLPKSVDELNDGTLVCLLKTIPNFGSFLSTNQLITLDGKTGAVLKNVEFSTVDETCDAVKVITHKDQIYTFSTDGYSYSIIQKFDKDLNRLSTVTINDFGAGDAIMNNDSLMILDGASTLVRLDTSLNIIDASHYEITEPLDIMQRNRCKIIVDNGKVYLFQDFLNSSGGSETSLLSLSDFSLSRHFKGLQGFTLSNNMLYLSKANDASGGATVLTKYDLLGKQIWAKQYSNMFGGFFSIGVHDDKVYSADWERDFLDTFYVANKIVKSDTSGVSSCSVDLSGFSITYDTLHLVKTNLTFTTSKLDTIIHAQTVLVNTDFAYADSLYCSSESTTSIHHLGSTTDIEVYPTITSGIVHLNHVDVLKGSSYQLVNVNGQVMINGKLKNVNNSLDISNLPDGFYLLRVLDEKTKVYSTFKIVKQSN
jgi:hypothetical protein